MRTESRVVGLAVVSVVALATSVMAQTFDPLFRVTAIEGACKIKKPEAKAFEPATPGKAYPLGTIIQTEKKSKATICLSTDDSLLLTASSEATIQAAADNANNRSILLKAGGIQSATRENLPENAIVVETASASCDAFTGHINILVDRDSDGMAVMDVAVESGSARLRGPQFVIPKMKVGSTVHITSTADRSLTRIVNAGGDYKIALDNGTGTPVVFNSTAKSTVRIGREYAKVGGKLGVSVFATESDGKNPVGFAYVVGEPGLLVSGLPVAADEHSSTNSIPAAPAP